MPLGGVIRFFFEPCCFVYNFFIKFGNCRLLLGDNSVFVIHDTICFTLLTKAKTAYFNNLDFSSNSL